jgi:hypothetical protein
VKRTSIAADRMTGSPPDADRRVGQANGPVDPFATALDDYRLAVRSRRISVLGRKDVISGRARVGIFGEGKEVPQIALARERRPHSFPSVNLESRGNAAPEPSP